MDQEKQQAPEIDLAGIVRTIGNGIRGSFQSVIRGIALLRKIFIDKIYFFISLIAIAITWIFVENFTNANAKYWSSMTLRCDYVNLRILQTTIEKFNLLCKEKEREGLSKILGIGQSTAKNILEFQVVRYMSEDDRVEAEILKEQLKNVTADKKELADRIMEKIDLSNRQVFQISIIVKQPDVVESMDSALVNYFRNTEYIKKRLESNKALLLARRAKLQRESQKMDSLKNVLFENFRTMSKQSREGSNNVILSDKYLTDPLNVFREDLTLHREMQSIDLQLKLNPDFEVIDGLTTFRTPSNFRLSLRLLIAITIATTAGYLLLGLWNFNKYLASLTDKPQA